MHLKFDKVFCTILFFIGLVLAGGTVGALMLIFSAGDSVPLSAETIYAERAAEAAAAATVAASSSSGPSAASARWRARTSSSEVTPASSR